MTAETAGFERGVKPLLRIALAGSANAVARYRPSAVLRARIEELADKSTDGHLSASERKEYIGYVRANKFVAILKRHALPIILGKMPSARRRMRRAGRPRSPRPVLR